MKNGKSMSVMPIGERSQDVANPITVHIVNRVQCNGTESMHDRHWVQSGPRDDRALQKVCTGRALHNCLSRRDMRSSDQYVDSKKWQHESDNGTAFIREPIKELMRRSQVAQAHSSTYHTPNKQLIGEKKSASGVDIEGVLFGIHE